VTVQLHILGLLIPGKSHNKASVVHYQGCVKYVIADLSEVSN